MPSRLASLAAVAVLSACGTFHVAAEPATESGAVPWLPLPAAHQFVGAPLSSPVPPMPVPAGTPACQASQLEGVSAGEGAATGNVDMPLLFRNKSGSECYVEGFAVITVLDAHRNVLAVASDERSKGTFFADGPAIPVLARHGTAALPPAAQGWGLSRGVPGQVFTNFSWYDCREPRAAQLIVGLPGGGGSFTMPFDLSADASPACGGTGGDFRAVSRGPFSPAGVETAPALQYIAVHVTISAPASVHRGQLLTYVVSIQNTSPRDYVMTPCADYNEALQDKLLLATYQLNCSPVGHIGPGATVTFEMRAQVPVSVRPGPNRLTWNLVDGRLDAPAASAPIAIT